MNCAAVENVADLFAERRLSSGRMAAVEKHLAACPPCTARLKSEAPPASPAAAAPQSLKDRIRRNLVRAQEQGAAALPAAPREAFGDWRPMAVIVAVYAAFLIWSLGLAVVSQKFVGGGLP